MKLTYTLEFDVERVEGPNVKKDRVSAALINALFRAIGPDYPSPSLTIKGKSHTDIAIRDLAVWAHDDSLPNAAALSNRDRADVPEGINERVARAQDSDPMRP